MLGPVFAMELRARARRLRFYLARSLVAAGLSVIVSFGYFEFHRTTLGYRSLSIQELAILGDSLARTFIVAQFFTLLFLAPVYCAGSIAGDRERRVLELLFMTRLRNSEIVAGKFMVRLLDLSLLAAAAVPVASLCSLLGGVRWQGLVVAAALTLVMIAFVASVSLMVSIVSSRVMNAVILTYVLLLIAWLALPIVVSMPLAAVPVGGWHWWVWSLNPILAIIGAVDPRNVPWAGADHWCIGVYGAATLVLLAAAVLFVRSVGLWASRQRVPRQRVRNRRDQAHIWSNPVAWREVRTIAVHRRMRWVRIFALVMLITLSSPVWLTYLADVTQGGNPLPADNGTLNMVVVTTAITAWMLMVLQGSMSFAYERDHSTLDALLTTPLSAMQIVVGKLAGILRSSLFAVGFPLFFVGLGAIHDIITPRAAVLSAAVILVVSVLAAAAGLLSSIVIASSLRASSWAMVAGMILLIGVPIVHQVHMQWFRRAAFRLTAASPSINLSYALDEGPWHRGGVDLMTWDRRFGISCFHSGCDAVLAMLIVLLATQRLERQHRIAPRRAVFGTLNAVIAQPKPLRATLPGDPAN